MSALRVTHLKRQPMQVGNYIYNIYFLFLHHIFISMSYLCMYFTTYLSPEARLFLSPTGLFVPVSFSMEPRCLRKFHKVTHYFQYCVINWKIYHYFATLQCFRVLLKMPQNKQMLQFRINSLYTSIFSLFFTNFGAGVMLS